MSGRPFTSEMARATMARCWASPEYRALQDAARARLRAARDVTAAFLSRIEFEPMSGCWIWIGNRFDTGYGACRKTVAGEVLAHRVSWRLFVGLIPPGMFLLHRCDTPPCVNPVHLRVGDHDDNMRDMVTRDRADDRRGSRSPSAKLTEAQIPEIRRLHAAGVPSREIGEMFGVTASAIQQITAGTRWTHA